MMTLSAPIPGARGDLPPLLGRCAAAYQRGDTKNGKRLYEQCYSMINATIHTAVNQKLDENKRDDIIQDTHLRVWRTLEKGIVPSIRLLASNVMIDAYRKTPQGNARYLTKDEVERINRPASVERISHALTFDPETVRDPSDRDAIEIEVSSYGSLEHLKYHESYTEVWTDENSEAI